MARVVPMIQPTTTPASAYCSVPQDALSSFFTLAALVQGVQRTFSGSATRTDQLELAKANLECIAELAKITAEAIQ